MPKPIKGQVGFIEKTKSSRAVGHTKGRAGIEADSHAYSKLLEGVNKMIDVYENKQQPLSSVDQEQLDYFIYLRETIEGIRNDTLEDENKPIPPTTIPTPPETQQEKVRRRRGREQNQGGGEQPPTPPIVET